MPMLEVEFGTTRLRVSQNLLKSVRKIKNCAE
jgi:hypothetical protein